MQNEMNLFDILLAKKLGGGGGGDSPVIYTATGWNELPAIPDVAKYFPINIDPTADYALGFLTFNFNGLPVSIPVTVSNSASYKEISGGVCNSMGTAAVMSLTYDNVDEEWSVSKAFTNMLGTWIEITSDVQTDASDIILTLYK